MAGTNVDLTAAGVFNNLGTVANYKKPLMPKEVWLVPKGTVIPATAMVDRATFKTYVDGKFIADDPNVRWRALTKLDDFKNDSKKKTVEDSGKYQFAIYKSPQKFSFRMMKEMGDYIQARSYDNCQGKFDHFYLDDNGTPLGQHDATGNGGLAAFGLGQLSWDSRDPFTVANDNKYIFDITHQTEAETNVLFRYYDAAYSAGVTAALSDAVAKDETATLGTPLGYTSSTDMIITMKKDLGTTDLVALYGANLVVAMFVASNLTSGLVPTLAIVKTGNIIVAGQNYYYIQFRLSVNVPASGDIVQIALRAPSVTNPLVPNFNAVTEIITPGVNGNNAAVRVFP